MCQKRPELFDARLPQRFWDKVTPEPNGGCWLWTGVDNGNGYAMFWWLERKQKVPAHKLAYEILIGPVPKGLDLDHLCRVRSCVNPAHLEPVTRAVNLLRGDRKTKLPKREKCDNGHALDELNTYSYKGSRMCKTCRRDTLRAWRRHNPEKYKAQYIKVAA